MCAARNRIAIRYIVILDYARVRVQLISFYFVHNNSRVRVQSLGAVVPKRYVIIYDVVVFF